MRKVCKICLYVSLLVLVSCGQVQIDETPTRGRTKIGVDDSYKLLIDTEIFTFESLYRNAHVEPVYKTELEILDDFMKDSIRCMVTSRELTKNEIDFLAGKQIIARSTHVANDAIAFITNKANTDSLLKYSSIRAMFEGKIDDWKQINKQSSLGKLRIVFDSDKSGNARYVMQKLDLPSKFPSYCSAVHSNEEVVNYVESHQNAIGIISVNWISDRQDSVSHSFLKKIQVVAVTSELDPDGVDYYRPYQGFVADKSYPFIRKVYVITRETFTGLGSGFAAFVAGDIGQRIILKSGMVPSVMPVRLIQIKSK
jgi:phosphate transport system substrate-binding protein